MTLPSEQQASLYAQPPILIRIETLGDRMERKKSLKPHCWALCYPRCPRISLSMMEVACFFSMKSTRLRLDRTPGRTPGVGSGNRARTVEGKNYSMLN